MQKKESLGVSITSTLGNKCNGGNGKNLGLIIGLSVGIPCAALIAGFVVGLFVKKRKRLFDKEISKMGEEMKSMQK